MKTERPTSWTVPTLAVATSPDERQKQRRVRELDDREDSRPTNPAKTHPSAGPVPARTCCAA